MVYGPKCFKETKMSKGIRIGKAGLNPTIPLCPVCGEPKNQIMFTGLIGERWAKKHGHKDGNMPMYVHVYGDREPCDACKEKGIALFEIKNDKSGPTGMSWLVKEEFVQKVLTEEAFKKAKERRVCLITEADAYGLGLHTQEDSSSSEQ